MIVDAEDDVASVRRLGGAERDQVVADFVDTLQRLLDTAALLLPEPPSSTFLAPEPDPVVATAATEFDDLAFEEIEPGEVALQATWHLGQLVV